MSSKKDNKEKISEADSSKTKIKKRILLLVELVFLIFAAIISVILLGPSKENNSNDNQTKEEYQEPTDTEGPVLVLKENVEVTEGETITSEQIVESCIDNSESECIILFLDADDNEIDTLTLNPGEYDVIVVAYDASKNRTQETTKVNVTPVESADEETPANTSSNSNNGSNTSKPNNNNSSNTNTNNTSSNNSNTNQNNNNSSTVDKQETPQTPSVSVCEPSATQSSIPVYMKANCVERNSSEDKANQTKMSSSALSNQILYGSNYDSPARAELKKCDTYFRNINGDTNSYCADFTTAPIVIYSTDGRIYGYAVKFTMKYADVGSSSYNKIAAEGYVNPGNDTIAYTTKNIPY